MSTAPSLEPSPRGTPAPPSRRALQPTAVDLWHAAGLGVVLTLVFYGAAVYPLRGDYFGRIFLERGWITRIEAFLAFWAIAFMSLKALWLRRQRGWFAATAGALAGEGRIAQAECDRLANKVLESDPSQGRGFLAVRLPEVLACFGARGDRGEAAALLQRLSESDANGVESSYTMLRVVIWAIPIIGFIGTVMGLGGAVGGFAGSLDRASDIAELKSSLNGVTSGLSVAFDATFAALAISLLIMFPASWLEKAEMELLAATDDCCSRGVLARLEQPTSSTRGAEGVAEAVERALAPHLAVLDQWRSALAVVGEDMVKRVGSEWERVHRDQRAEGERREESLRTALEAALSRNTDDLRTVVAQLRTIDRSLADAAAATSHGLSTDLRSLGVLFESHAGLAAQTDRRMTDALTRLEALVAAETQAAKARWEQSADQEAGRAAASLRSAQGELSAAQLALAQVAGRFSAALEHTLAAQTSQIATLLDASSQQVERAHAVVAEDLRRVGAEWTRSLERAAQTLSDAIGDMTEAAGQERSQAVAKLEVLMGRLSTSTPLHTRRGADDRRGVAPPPSTTDDRTA